MLIATAMHLERGQLVAAPLWTGGLKGTMGVRILKVVFLATCTGGAMAMSAGRSSNAPLVWGEMHGEGAGI